MVMSQLAGRPPGTNLVCNGYKDAEYMELVSTFVLCEGRTWAPCGLCINGPPFLKGGRLRRGRVALGSRRRHGLGTPRITLRRRARRPRRCCTAASWA